MKVSQGLEAAVRSRLAAAEAQINNALECHSNTLWGSPAPVHTQKADNETSNFVEGELNSIR